MNKFLLVFSLAGLLAACSSPSEDDLLREPLQLQGIAVEAKLKKVWQKNIGKGQSDSFSALAPFIYGDDIYVADSGGVVQRLDKRTGKKYWSIKLKQTIKSGAAYSADTVYVGLEQGVLVALSADNGAEKWRADIGSEVLSPVAAARGIVIVHAVNGALIGVDATDGREIWRNQTTVPVLSVRGTSTPIIIENLAFIGLANGKLVSLDIATGVQRWASRLASADGDSDIERITDVDATPLVIGGHIVAGSYNGRVALIDAASGQTYWTKDANVAGNISEGFSNIYFASVEGELLAYEAEGGQLKWVNEYLLRRGLGDTVTWVNYVAVADYQGYLHLLSQVDGQIIGRARVDKSLPRAPLMVNDNLLYVLSNSGRLTAYSVQARK